ncbi:hypothetical protein IFR05_003720 [Cadophora sp. M221]|nr:hypothetical protein IFR05_003720 [Cadophora sp. M221]
MRAQSLALLFLANYCNAAKYCLDISCGSNSAGIKGGIQEAVDLAANAVAVMTAHADDPWVQKTAKYILGTIDFDGRFSRAKGVFTAVAAFEKEPSPFHPQDIGWTSVKRNTDLELYCNDARFTELVPDVKMWKDAANPKKLLMEGDHNKIVQCYKTDFVLGSGEPGIKAMTKNSGTVNYRGYTTAKLLNPSARLADYSSETPNIASAMDICTWFTSKAVIEGWPTITAQRVDNCKTDDFKAKLQGNLTPLDGLKTFGCTMLHELTHTIQGGRLIDIPEEDLPPGITSCYGWQCIGILKNERNAGDNDHTGRERRSPNEDTSEELWARRLDSSWGPHWECEEPSFAKDDKLHKNPIDSLLFVCKRMFLDICDLVAETSEINVIDHDTSDELLPNANGLERAPNRFWSFLHHITPRIHNLNVTLRLPLVFYRAVEDEDAGGMAVDRSNITSSAISNKWIKFWTAVCSLQRLRNFAPPPFTIERRLHQRYHCEEWPPGQFSSSYKADFPVLHELGDVQEFGMTLQEVEEWETELWNQGEDVYGKINQFASSKVNHEPF